MQRTIILSLSAVILGSAAYAGQVTIGSNITYNGGTGVFQSQNGLTKAYLTGTATSCAGFQLYGNACATGSVSTGALERNFDVTLFNGVLDTANSGAGAMPAANLPTAPFTGYMATMSGGGAPATAGAQPSGATMTGGGTTFSMLADSGSVSSDFWDLSSSTSSVTIPIGIMGVDEVSTMINDIYGTARNSYSSVTFNFATTSNGAAGTTLTPVVVNLYDGVEVRSGTDCTGAGGPTPASFTACPGYSYTTAADTSGAGISGTNLSGLNDITTTQLYTSTYTGSSSGTGAMSGFANSSGNVVLDDQGFNFGTNYLSDYLVSIQINETNGALGTSRLGLTGVTVDTNEVVPEPSTWIMLGVGVLAIAAARRFRKTSIV